MLPDCLKQGWHTLWYSETFVKQSVCLPMCLAGGRWWSWPETLPVVHSTHDICGWACQPFAQTIYQLLPLPASTPFSFYFPGGYTGFPQSWKVRESHGKIYGHGKSWKKSWKIKKMSKVMEKWTFYPNSGPKIIQDMVLLKIVQWWISPEKFARIPTAQMVMENHYFFPHLH